MASTGLEGEQSYAPKTPRTRRRFILCFDGTGNKFQGDGGDSNILKIYSMLDRTDKTQFHYYQPGIGTYTNTKSLATEGVFARMHSWYSKAKDSAVGSTLADHVMAGYRFLMRYYEDGDDIYFFGFSRGAYIARFLAQLLDHVGLLSAGNEEMIRFVWKTFSKWQQRQGDEEEKEKIFNFMKAFRETFSRPVRRIRFLGLFDTVNSVSKFETAWLNRSKKFPYTARSRAITIRHAVAIDERRAKFRQDLISQKRQPDAVQHHHHFKHQEKTSSSQKMFANQQQLSVGTPADHMGDRFRRSASRARSRGRSTSRVSGRCGYDPSNASDGASFQSNEEPDDDEMDENIPQNIEELWFPGGHADIGGGWPPDSPEYLNLSHAPLAWMVHEAQKAGLNFDEDKMRSLKVFYDDEASIKNSAAPKLAVPQIEINDDMVESSPVERDSYMMEEANVNKEFIETIHSSCTRGKIHDCLSFKQGSTTGGVIAWNIMEFLPFRRMDLQADGSWKAIRWPLPMGETRDVPNEVKIHSSVIHRMQADESYRPGNLIMSGGGRGRRHAPKHMGIGEWKIVQGEGHPVGEVWVKKNLPAEIENGVTNGKTNGRTHGDKNGGATKIED